MAKKYLSFRQNIVFCILFRQVRHQIRLPYSLEVRFELPGFGVFFILKPQSIVASAAINPISAVLGTQFIVKCTAQLETHKTPFCARSG
jgi:hypothetical protein